jgi:hypothetical protein
MEMICAECGCLVENGVRVVPCETEDCCCVDLPVRTRTPDDMATLLNQAFETRDLDLLGRLLADDARWGDDGAINKCRSRADVVGTFARLLGEGVEGSVAQTETGQRGVAVQLQVRWPNPGDAGRGEDFWHALPRARRPDHRDPASRRSMFGGQRDLWLSCSRTRRSTMTGTKVRIGASRHWSRTART